VKCVDLLVGNSKLAAHGSINVLSKLATIQVSDATIDQPPQTCID
jgi:hypothetical protein